MSSYALKQRPKDQSPGLETRRVRQIEVTMSVRRGSISPSPVVALFTNDLICASTESLKRELPSRFGCSKLTRSSRISSNMTWSTCPKPSAIVTRSFSQVVGVALEVANAQVSIHWRQGWHGLTCQWAAIQRQQPFVWTSPRKAFHAGKQAAATMAINCHVVIDHS